MPGVVSLPSSHFPQMTDKNKEPVGGASLKASDLHLHTKPCHLIMKVLTIFKEDMMESSKP